MKIFLRIFIYSLLLIAFLSLLDPYSSVMELAYPHYLLFILCFGWVAILLVDTPNVEWNIGLLIFSSILFAGLFITLHLLAKEWYRKWKLSEWKMRWTISVSLLILFLLGAGISMTGFSHQIYQMFVTDSEPFFHTNTIRPYRRTQSKNNLKQMGLAVHNFHDVYLSFPSYGFNPAKHPYPESWETKMLPFMERGDLYNNIDFTVPWDHQKNKKAFQTKLHVFLNPHFDNPHIDNKDEGDDSYALSHYSSNALLFARSGKFGFRNIEDGTANTIMGGEISDNLPAWGKPGNWRDLRMGLNNPKKGFRGPFKGVTHLLLTDGTVRLVSNDIDPKVLKALSTPNGGEENHDF